MKYNRRNLLKSFLLGAAAIFAGVQKNNLLNASEHSEFDISSLNKETLLEKIFENHGDWDVAIVSLKRRLKPIGRLDLVNSALDRIKAHKLNFFADKMTLDEVRNLYMSSTKPEMKKAREIYGAIYEIETESYKAILNDLLSIKLEKT